MRNAAWFVVVGALVGGCGKKADKTPTGDQPTPAPVAENSGSGSGSGSIGVAVAPPIDAPPPPAAVGPKDFELDVESSLFKSHVKFTLTSDLVTDAYGGRFKEPGEYGSTLGYIQFTPTCGGGCTEAEMTTAIADMVVKAPEHDAQPNLNTGDPKLDAERLDVTPISVGDLDGGGKYVEYRVTKPPTVTGPYPVGYKALCIKWSPAKDYFVTAQVYADTDHEAALAPGLLAACKGFTVTAPAAAGSGSDSAAK